MGRKDSMMSATDIIRDSLKVNNIEYEAGGC